MKQFLFTLFFVVVLSACSSKVYNSQLKQIQLGMTQEQVISLMGDKYTVTQQKDDDDKTIEYKDRYKNHWFFQFVDGKLNKWYKETEN